MIVGIDATEFLIDRGGVRHYLKYLMQSLQEIDKENTYRIVVHFWNKRRMDSYSELQSLLTAENFKLSWIKFPGTAIWSLGLPVDFFTGPMDVYHGAGHFVDRTLKGKIILTVHDLDYCMIPDLLPKEWVRKKAKYIGVSIKRASAVIVPTHFIKEVLLSRFPLDKDQVFVIPHGVSHSFSAQVDSRSVMRIKKKYGIEGDYILFAGQTNPNKNLLRLLDAYNILRETYNIPHFLVIAGAKRVFFKEVYNRVIESGLRDKVKFTGYINESDLQVLYSGASLFVLPSLYEGFGIPLLEAMASGVPIVASSAASLPEVIGDAGLLVNPLDAEEIAYAMGSILSDTQIRERLIRQGLQRVKQFTWDKTARQTLNLYKAVSS